MITTGQKACTGRLSGKSKKDYRKHIIKRILLSLRLAVGVSLGWSFKLTEQYASAGACQGVRYGNIKKSETDMRSKNQKGYAMPEHQAFQKWPMQEPRRAKFRAKDF
jgi:hypothetical protein